MFSLRLLQRSCLVRPSCNWSRHPQLTRSTVLSQHATFSTSQSDGILKQLTGLYPRLKRNLKSYGKAFTVVSLSTYTVTIGVFYSLLWTKCIDINTFMAFASEMVDLSYWVSRYGYDVSILTGNCSEIALTLLVGELTFPLQMVANLLVLLVLRWYGIVGVAKKAAGK